MNAAYDSQVVKVADLLGRPGTSRQLRLTMAVPDGVALALVEVVGPVRLGGVIESVVDGVLVRGTVRTPARMSCSRCLRTLDEEVGADVVELFEEDGGPTGAPEVDLAERDPGYEIRHGHIDLDTLVRDAVMPALPYQPRCRPDCAGLCARCGANRNEGDCGCVDAEPDPRWAPLAGLRLPKG